MDVLPNTEGLSEKLKAAVEEAKTVLTVPVRADASGLKEEVDAAAAESKAEINVPVKGDTTGLGNQIAKDGEADAESGGKSLGSKFGSGFSSVINKVGPAALGGLAAGLGLAVDEGLKLDDSTRQLNLTIQNTGESVKGTAPLIAAAQAQMEKYGYTNVETNQSLTSLIRITGSVKEATELEGDAANLAAAKHISLAAATQQVQMTAVGGAKALKQLGDTTITGATTAKTLTTASATLKDQIQAAGGMAAWSANNHMSLQKAQTLASEAASGSIPAYNALGFDILPKSATSAEKAAEAHNLLAKYQGFAADKAETLEGKMEVAKATFTDAAAKIGVTIVPIMTKLLGIFDAHIQTIIRIAEVIVPLVAGIFLLTKAVTFARDAWAALQVIMDANPFVAIGLAVVVLAAVVIKYHKQILTAVIDTWHTITTDITNIWNDFLSFAKAWWPLLLGPGGLILKYHTQIYQAIENIWHNITSGVSAIWNDFLSFAEQWWPLLLGPAGLIVKFHNQIFAFIQDIWNRILGWFKGIWSSIFQVFQSATQNITNWLRNGWLTVESDIRNVFTRVLGWVENSFLSPLENAFRTSVNAIGTIFDGIKNATESPVKFVINSVYDPIASTIDKVTSFLHLGSPLPQVHMADGGVVPGPKGVKKDIIPAMLMPDEIVLSHAQIARMGGHAAVASMAGGAPKGQFNNGVLHAGFGWNPISDVEQVGSDALSFGKKLAAGALSATVKPVLEHIINAMPNLGSGQWGTAVKQVPVTMVNDFVNWLKGEDAKSSASGSGSSGGGGSGQYTGKYGAGVSQWTSDVDAALKQLGLSTSLAGQVLYQMQTESGGNPNAINNYDINAQNGDPSRGLLQTIMSTFKAYAGPYANRSIYDPMANIYAAINYAMHTYGPTLLRGGMGMGSGHGYASGTNSTAPGFAMVGENGPELVQFSGGQRVYNAQQTQQMTGGRPPVNVNFYGTQYPNAEQIANLKIEIGMALEVSG
jgi:SLT domain-containing protein